MSPPAAHGSASKDIKKESAAARLLGSGMLALIIFTVARAQFD